MDVHAGVGEEPVAGDVVLVAVAVDHGVDGDRGAALGHDRDRRVDDDRLGLAATSSELPDGYVPFSSPTSTLTSRVSRRSAYPQSTTGETVLPMGATPNSCAKSNA